MSIKVPLILGPLVSSAHHSRRLSSMRYLPKSEPNPRLEDGVDVSYPFSRLIAEKDQCTSWEGVRNAVAGKTLKGVSINRGTMLDLS